MAIVYFDGQCNVCNRFVDFLIRHDSCRRLKFAPLQGAAAGQNLPATLRNELSTMILQLGPQTYLESDAAIRTIVLLGGGWTAMKIFLLVPKFLRDGVYRWIANHRNLFAGRRATCRTPSAEEKDQFLN